MRLAAFQPVAVPSLDSIKMEDRKRLADRDDAAPPPKRQAVAVNGAKHPDADMPWKDDIEAYQKDAIFRQMKEYKRESNILEARVAELERDAKYHDDHLRIVDLWFSQLIDETKIIAQELNSDSDASDNDRFPTSLLFEDNENFKAHLNARSQSIKSILSVLFKKIPSVKPDVAKLQGEITRLLALEKSHIMELQRVMSDKKQLDKRLDAATYRYMVAERKMDRMKSAQVAKLEKAATQGSVSTEELVAGKRGQSVEINGSSDVVIGNEASEMARKEAVAASAKRKEQIEQLEAENSSLTAEVTALKGQLAGLSDDDFAKSTLYKNFKSQHEDLIRRINHLEATNIQLREDAKKLSEQRTAYRMQIEEESRGIVSDVEAQLVKAETDLARIRTSRDELLSDLSIKKATQDQHSASMEQLKELASARDSRIAALETEVERLRLQAREATASDSAENLATLGHDELLAKIACLQKEYSLLSNELPSMEAAWKKAQAVASKKIIDASAMEEQISRFSAEKAKADQKYFAAMKAKETREAEIRTLRAQNAKSSEIVSQLKDTASSSQSLAINLEKQLAEAKDALANVSNQHRVSQLKISEIKTSSDGSASLIAELKKSLTAKDSTHQDALRSHRQTEVELEELKVRLAETKRSLEGWKKKGLGNQSDEYEMLRTIAICTVCRKNFKNTAIKTCGHVFCQECVDERITARSRKCPNCGKSFGSGDHMRVTL
jgi:E3 ubiquitin-protein ligase BRE1